MNYLAYSAQEFNRDRAHQVTGGKKRKKWKQIKTTAKITVSKECLRSDRQQLLDEKENGLKRLSIKGDK